MSDKVLEVKHLKKVFPIGNKNLKNREGFTAVEDISFFVSKGQCVGIVGESGSGKSTVARMITRLVDVTEGNIYLGEQEITRISGKALSAVYRKVQMVFQNPAESFDPKWTLGDGIGESLRNQGFSRTETREKVIQLLNQCGLDETFAKRYPYEVSGGQCQRAAIARALAVNPELLICDEPTSALDVTVQRQIVSLLKQLKEQRKLSLLFICHDMALVQEFCDYVLVMEKGQIVEEGIPDQIIHKRKIFNQCCKIF